MKISVNDEHLFTLSEIQKKVIKNDIHEDIFEQDMKRRLHYILMHKYERSFERLKSEWLLKLQEKYEFIPTNPDALAEFIFSQPDYKNKAERDIKQEDVKPLYITQFCVGTSHFSSLGNP